LWADDKRALPIPFRIRLDGDTADLPSEMASTNLVIENEYSALARRLEVLLTQSGVELVGPDQATAILEVPVNRVVLSRQTLRQTREISFDEQEILGASREQEYLQKDLANLMARLILQRLEGSGN
jgi:outer membrane lipopolysaccharide assembly protein LptE/RlpB